MERRRLQAWTTPGSGMMIKVIGIIGLVAPSAVQAYNYKNIAKPDIIVAPAYTENEHDPSCQWAQCPEVCHDVDRCPLGVGLVKDRCGCCYVCARQINEYCDAFHPCDTAKGLTCRENTCETKQGRKCYVDRHVYDSGQSFNVSCTMTCTCIDGHLGCNPRCRIEPSPSLSKCHEARLIRKRGHCCRQWICLDDFKISNKRRYQRLKAIADRDPQSQYWSVGGRVDAAYTIPIERRLRTSDNCLVQTSQWTECSRVCGWGFSERVLNDNDRCVFEREQRLCQQRPCVEQNLEMNRITVGRAKIDKRAPGFSPAKVDALHPRRKPKRCQRLRKSLKKVRFQFDGCMSKRLYKPRYCGTCTDNRCCRPNKVKTVNVSFKCEGSEGFRYKMALVKSCKCERDCSAVVNAFQTGVFMGNDIAYEPKSINIGA